MAAPAPAPDATRLGLNQATAGSKGRVKRKSLPKRDGPIWKSVTGLVVRGGVVYSPRNTCVFTCIQFEGPKSTEYTYSHAHPRVFCM